MVLSRVWFSGGPCTSRSRAGESPLARLVTPEWLPGDLSEQRRPLAGKAHRSVRLANNSQQFHGAVVARRENARNQK